MVRARFGAGLFGAGLVGGFCTIDLISYAAVAEVVPSEARIPPSEGSFVAAGADSVASSCALTSLVVAERTARLPELTELAAVVGYVVA